MANWYSQLPLRSTILPQPLPLAPLEHRKPVLPQHLHQPCLGAQIPTTLHPLDRIPCERHLLRNNIPNGNHLLISRHVGGVGVVAGFGCGLVGLVTGLVDDSVEAGLGGGIIDVDHPGGGFEVIALVERVVDC